MVKAAGDHATTEDLWQAQSSYDALRTERVNKSYFLTPASQQAGLRE